MATLKSKHTRKITPETLALLKRIADTIWDLGAFHIYCSQWMRNPMCDQFVAPCGYRGTRTETGYVTVCIAKDGGVFVQILMPGEPIKSFIPAFDFPTGW